MCTLLLRHGQAVCEQLIQTDAKEGVCVITLICNSWVWDKVKKWHDEESIWSLVIKQSCHSFLLLTCGLNVDSLPPTISLLTSITESESKFHILFNGDFNVILDPGWDKLPERTDRKSKTSAVIWWTIQEFGLVDNLECTKSPTEKLHLPGYCKQEWFLAHFLWINWSYMCRQYVISPSTQFSDKIKGEFCRDKSCEGWVEIWSPNF